MPPLISETPRPSLPRTLGLGPATALIIGEVVAIGIFLTPASMAKSLAAPGLTLAVWLGMGVMTLCGALCYGELASRHPEAGGGYVYLREGFGRPLAFLYGWMSLVVMDPGITAALAVGLASYLGYLIDLTPFATKAVGVAAVAVLAAVNIRGAALGAGVIRGLTILKLGFLAFIVLWGLGFRLGDWANLLPLMERRPGAGPLFPALAGGVVAAFFSFGGWWDLAKVAGEVRDPARTLPRALAWGVATVTLVHMLTTIVFLYLVPLEQVTTGETFAAQAGEVLFGPTGGGIFAVIVIVAILGSLAALLMASPRVYFAMARDRLFFPAVATVHPRFGTPARAITIQAALASLLVVVGSFEAIVSYFIFVVVIFLALTVVALLRMRRANPEGGGFKTPGYPWTPAAFLLLTVVMLVLLGAGSPGPSLLGTGVVALGLPVYFWRFGRRRDSAGADSTRNSS
jgi:APA family basic amino acid/polyamine antiporter